jgi:hypothetical protein
MKMANQIFVRTREMSFFKYSKTKKRIVSRVKKNNVKIYPSFPQKLSFFLKISHFSAKTLIFLQRYSIFPKTTKIVSKTPVYPTKPNFPLIFSKTSFHIAP